MFYFHLRVLFFNSFSLCICFLPAAIGFNVETVTYKNLKFQVWDLGGQTSIRLAHLSLIRGSSLCFGWPWPNRNHWFISPWRILCFWHYMSDRGTTISCSEAVFSLIFFFISICFLFVCPLSFLQQDPTGGAITQIPTPSSMWSTAATVTEWVSPSLSWWPCWRWEALPFEVDPQKWWTLKHMCGWCVWVSFTLD